MVGLKHILLITFSFSFLFARSQSPIDTLQREFNPVKFGVAAGAGGLFYAGTLTGLATIWYKDKNYVGFHFTNDNAGWMQIDKYGHAYTCYLYGKLGINTLKWSGVSDKKAIIFGGTYGFLYMTSVEVIDGHYSEWGFSPMDMVANASGSLLLVAQELAFKKQILTYKFSYHNTKYAQYRPASLGEHQIEKIVEDYNGQTYWLSLNLKSVFPHQKFLPNWLNIAGGYGANGMLAAETNPTYGITGEIPHFERYRSYYLSLDIDFDKIKTHSKFLKTAFSFLNLIKFPLPTVEFNTLGEQKFHPFYF